jgi:predicted TIM-barrel fold metal-dependent hydrolase
MIYGIHLSDEVLEKIYNKNAQKIFGRLSISEEICK